MAVTYEPIATTTLGSANSTITFSSIPATYTDLRLVFTAKITTGGFDALLTFNNDNAGNYANVLCYTLGAGGAASSSANTGQTYITLDFLGLDSNTPKLFTIDIFSYAGSTNKTMLRTASETLTSSGLVGTAASLWKNTAAISTIKIVTGSSTFTAGTTATLYGIKAA